MIPDSKKKNLNKIYKIYKTYKNQKHKEYYKRKLKKYTYITTIFKSIYLGVITKSKQQTGLFSILFFRSTLMVSSILLHQIFQLKNSIYFSNYI